MKCLSSVIGPTVVTDVHFTLL